LLITSLGSVAAFNFYIDPLWLFGHSNRHNNVQAGFDERQQKSNRLHFSNTPYDALLLGSSRSTYINQHGFTGLRVFNYAVSGMRPEEYAPYIAYAESQLGQPFDTVFIGVDFFGSNKNYGGRAAPAEQFFRVAGQPFYRLESLLSFETLRKSLENLKKTGQSCDCYRRDNVKLMLEYTGEQKTEIIQKDLGVFRKHIYGPDYAYDESLSAVWHGLRKRFPNSRFVVFTTPISAPLLLALVECGRWPDYERWLREMVEAFGSVHDFMGINTITADLNNYQDASHFYLPVGTLIARSLSEAQAPLAGFGQEVTRKNLEQHLRTLKMQIDTAASRGK
jgi:hypothetical protein